MTNLKADDAVYEEYLPIPEKPDKNDIKSYSETVGDSNEIDSQKENNNHSKNDSSCKCEIIRKDPKLKTKVCNIL